MSNPIAGYTIETKILSFPMVSANRRLLTCILPSFLARPVATLIALGAIVGTVSSAQPQSRADQGASNLVAVLVSDIHFDPFADPSKVKLLANSPIENWEGILGESGSEGDQSYHKLLEDCGTRGADTPIRLLKASLFEIKDRAPDARLVTVTGDLLAHSFECKLRQTLPEADEKTRNEFAVKTISFVVRLMHKALPGVPIYWALGNNDSDCGDYRLDARSHFFSAIAPILTSDVPPSQRTQAVDDFSVAGYYAVDLPAPIRNGRLLIVDDTFMAARFSTCSGKDDRIGETLTLNWLRQQLDRSRALHQNVWVMGHIPPGIDLKGALSHGKASACGTVPKTYLDSETLADQLTDSSETVRVALFGHTHMDEMRLLTPRSSDGTPSAANVAMKIVPSISPINGNNPSFLIANVDLNNAELADFKLIAASGSDPATIHWNESYDYQLTYHEKAFNSGAMTQLAAAFRADDEAQKSESEAYIRNFMPGSGSNLLRLIWPAYACGQSSQDAAAFAKCYCAK